MNLAAIAPRSWTAARWNCAKHTRHSGNLRRSPARVLLREVDREWPDERCAGSQLRADRVGDLRAYRNKSSGRFFSETEPRSATDISLRRHRGKAPRAGSANGPCSTLTYLSQCSASCFAATQLVLAPHRHTSATCHSGTGLRPSNRVSRGPQNVTSRIPEVFAPVPGETSQRNNGASDGAPERIRTSGLCLRRAALYPAELRVRAGGV